MKLIQDKMYAYPELNKLSIVNLFITYLLTPA